MSKDTEIQELENYFRDPYVGDKLLKPPMSGVACANIRTALRLLDYEVAYGDQYDEELKRIILRFQTDHEHSSHDGLFGPGTRRLLTKVLIDRHSTEIFKRLTDPTEHETLLRLGQFFQDPRVGDGLLRPLMSGGACANIRTALRLLDYEVAYGDQYDEELKKVVLRFQIDYEHRSRDGLFGPGTRRLLVRVLVEKYGTGIFDRMQDSQEGRVATTIPDQEQERLIQLHKMLSSRFNDEDLRTLCFYLGVDYDNLPAQGKMGKARELIDYLRKRNLVYKLIDVGRELRPDIPWSIS